MKRGRKRKEENELVKRVVSNGSRSNREKLRVRRSEPLSNPSMKTVIPVEAL